MGTAERTEQKTVYDGFISYSHAADGLLAPRLQAGLQRFAKPWWKRRALRMFRDESSLSANPHLWSSITDALDTSGWFVLLLSPDAAHSVWVNQEIDYWKSNRDPSRILPVVTDGEFGWDGDVVGSAVPESLVGVFSEEPRWVDLRFARQDVHLDLKNPRFADAVADIGSALRGIPKDELASEEVRQHRLTTRTAWLAGLMLLALTSTAVVFGIQSARNADLAFARGLSAEAARLIPSDPELAAMLAVLAIDSTPAGSPISAEATDALWRSSQNDRRLGLIDSGFGGWVFVEASRSGERVLVTSEDGARVQMYDAEQDLIWEHVEDTTDAVTMTALSADGSLAIAAVLDLRAAASGRDQTLADDDLPNRHLVLDGDTGDVLHRLTWEDCSGVEGVAVSPDGRFMAVGSGLEGCEREGSLHWAEVFRTSDWSSVAFIPYPHTGFGGPLPEFDENGRLYLFLWREIQIFEAETFERVEFSGVPGLGYPLQDGSGVVVEAPGGLEIHRVPDGDVADRLGALRDPVHLPTGFGGSPSGRWIAAGTDGPYTTVFDLDTGEKKYRLRTGPMSNLAFDDGHDRLYVGSLEGTVSIWDISDSPVGFEVTATFHGDDWVVANTMAASETLGAVLTFDQEEATYWVRFFELSTGAQVGSRVRGESVQPLANDRFVVDEGLRWVVHDPATGVSDNFLNCDSPQPAICPDGGVGSAVFDLAPIAGSPSFLAFRDLLPPGSDGRVDTLNENGRLLDQGAWDGAIFLLDESGALVEDLSNSPVEAIAVESPLALWTDVALLQKGAESQRLVDIRSGEVLWSGGGAPFVDVDVDDRKVTFVSDDSVVQVDLDSFEPIEVSFDFGGVRGLSAEPSGSRVALGTAEGLAIVDLDLGGISQTLLIDGVSDVHWMDGEQILIATSAGSLGVVSLDTDALLNETRRSFRRGFTAAECTSFLIDPCPTLDELRGG